MSRLLLSILICCCCSQLVTSQPPMIVQPPQNQSVCEEGTANFTCVVMFSNPSATLGSAAWFNSDFNNVNGLPGISETDDSGQHSSPANVTNVLTVSNVNITNNGESYYCQQADRSDFAFLTVFALPSSSPENISVIPLNSTSFMVTWSESDPNYDYTVIWTNQNTGVMDSVTVQDNENSHIVTRLSNNTNYMVSVAAVNMCGNKTGNPTPVYDPPNQPNFTQCVSYDNGQPALQVLSYVNVTIPKMSLSLTFSASYQTGNQIGNSNSQLATCSLLSDMQYNCTANFDVDVIPSVDTIESVNVTVSGPYGDNSSVSTINLAVAALLNVMKNVMLTTVTLECTLPCFSPNIWCSLFNITPNNDEVITYGGIMGSSMSYNYPTQQIIISNLTHNTTYECCVVAIDTANNNMTVGDPVCDNFTITSVTPSGTPITTVPNEGDEDDTGLIVGICIGLLILILIIIICIGILYWYYKKKKAAVTASDRQELKSPTTSTIDGHKGGKGSEQPSNVPHQTAASGEEYALTTKAVTKPQQQQQPEEYAVVDKSKKKNSAANQGIMYADLQQLPSSGNVPSQNQSPTATYAQVA